MLCSDFFQATRNTLKKHGFPYQDAIEQNVKMQEFNAGGHYGIEISSMNNISILQKTFKLADSYGLQIDRVVECRGIVRLPDAEIKQMVDLCVQHDTGLVMSIGPRAISDIGAFASSNSGKRIGYRLRGMENLIHAIEDLKRGIALGVRGFTLYDEGFLYLVNKMREAGDLPDDVVFKYSVHAGCSNPIATKLLEEQGCDTINVVPDLSIEMLASFRPLVKAPIDVFSDTAKAAGGLLRTYDMAKVIKYASPVYLKCGPISQPEQNHLPTATEIDERVKQTVNVVEHIQRYLPEAERVGRNEKTRAMPVSSSEQVTSFEFERLALTG